MPFPSLPQGRFRRVLLPSGRITMFFVPVKHFAQCNERARSSRPPDVRGVLAMRGVHCDRAWGLEPLPGVSGRALFATSVPAQRPSDGFRLPVIMCRTFMSIWRRGVPLREDVLCVAVPPDVMRSSSARCSCSGLPTRRCIVLCLAVPPDLMRSSSTRCSCSGLPTRRCISSSAASRVARGGPLTGPANVVNLTRWTTSPSPLLSLATLTLPLTFGFLYLFGGIVGKR